MSAKLSVTKVVSNGVVIRYEFSKSALKAIVNDRAFAEVLTGCKSAVSDDTVSIPSDRAGQLVTNARRYNVEPQVNKVIDPSGKKVAPTPEQKLSAAGFKRVYVTREEFEDGIGTNPGVNFVKDGVWYTMTQALAEIA